jgi:hypothetical protein
MSCVLPIAVSILLALSAPGDLVLRMELDTVCGKVVHLYGDIEKPKDRFRQAKTKPLPHITLSLYPRNADEECCKAGQVIETLTTGRGGDFRFKTQAAGRYWLTALWQGRVYKTAIALSSVKSGVDFCPATTFQIDDSGKFTYAISVTVE